MGIVEFVVIAVVLGLLVYVVNEYLPIPPAIKKLILIAVVILLVIMLLRAMGILGGVDYPIPRVR